MYKSPAKGRKYIKRIYVYNVCVYIMHAYKEFYANNRESSVCQNRKITLIADKRCKLKRFQCYSRTTPQAKTDNANNGSSYINV